MRHRADTEIDWKAYMQEVSGYLSGERDYTLLKGDTGPLVYPAGFLYVYSALYHLTDGGVDIRTAQYVFGGIYLITLGVIMALYSQVQRRPTILLPFLILSKRLHSIYVLRLFNDPIAMLPLYLCNLAMIKGRYKSATILFSLAVSVKMNILLFAPGFALLCFLGIGLKRSASYAILALGVQVILAAPFLTTYPASYLSRAFEFSRVFNFQWTVNWRFLGQDLFLDRTFAKVLLCAHATLLLTFLAKWCRELGGSGAGAVRLLRSRLSGRGTIKLPADFLLTVMFTTNLIGLTCARSLHYQFYSWYAHTLPYLIWRISLLNLDCLTCVWGYRVGTMMGVEWAWNVYPSTSTSSACLLFAHLSLLAALWFTPTITTQSAFGSRKPKPGIQRQTLRKTN
ncbi:family 58 glycosyltransferase [Phlyctochytrium arcticum]|nr:family 58 glycosyltransferase [Phlyctochytrium arcticum]